MLKIMQCCLVMLERFGWLQGFKNFWTSHSVEKKLHQTKEFPRSFQVYENAQILCIVILCARNNTKNR